MQLSGLLGTQDLNDWEQGFVESVNDRTKAGKDTTGLTPRQVETVDRLYRRFFA